MQVMTWLLREQRFGIELTACREVAALAGVRRVPHSPASVVGIMNLRGEVLTLIDLRVLLGYENAASIRGEAIVRLKDDRHSVALMADSISDVIQVPESSLETRPAGLTESEDKYIRAITSTPGGVVVILNVRQLLSGKQ